MREFNDTLRISTLFNLKKKIKIANRAFSFILDKLNINYKLINNELIINNTLFEYVIILISKLLIRNKSRASRV